MKRAISLSKKSLGVSTPNPSVGAVIVKDGVVIGEGWTGPPGGPHAEINALNQAGDSASGADMYVTLEPCCHFGRTGPCTAAIIESGIKMIHVSALDPNPNVDGRGVKGLRDAGLNVSVGLNEKESIDVMEPHFNLMRTGRPLVIAKFAMSLDGKIAAVSGESKWITGVKSRESVHQLRAHSDAVMVGINTVLMDDPQLTARDGSLPKDFSQPLRVVVDSHGRTPATSAVCNGDAKTLIATSRDAIPFKFPCGVSVKAFPEDSIRVDLDALLKYLANISISSVLVEGGPSLIGSLFDQRLVDKVFAFVAPIIIGGSAKSAVGGKGSYHMRDVERLVDVELKSIDEDILLTGYCRKEE